MRKKLKVTLLLLLSLSLVLMIGCSGPSSEVGEAKEDEAPKSKETIFLNIGTAAVGGSYYPAGTSLANALNNNLKSFNIKANGQATGGSTENINMMRDGEMELAVLNSSVGYQAYAGKDVFENNAYNDLRTICQLWTNPIQMVVTKKSGVNTWQDLKGKKVSIGQAGSGSEVLTKEMLDGISGISIEDIKQEFLGFEQSADAMRDGRIDAAQLSGGIPLPSVLDLHSSNIGVKLLPMTQEDRDGVTSKYPNWSDFTIPANTYPGQTDPCDTVALFTQLVVRADLDEELIYSITKTLFENLDEIYNSYEALRGMTLNDATKGLIAPLHPGALRYFEEQGLEIPEDLIPPEYNK